MADEGQQPFYRWSGEDLLLSVLVQPRASKNAIVGIHGAHLKVRLTASPVDGKANQSLIKLLAKCFQVPQSAIDIEKGQTARSKRVRIQGPVKLPEFPKTSGQS